MLAWALCRTGEPEKGIDILLPLVQALKAERSVSYQITFLPDLAEGYLLAGEYEKARKTAQEAADLAERCGARWFLAFARRLLGEIALRTDPDEALAHFEKAVSISLQIKAENELALAYSGMGRYHKRQGNMEAARKYLTDALEIFERLGTLLEPDKVRNELADLPQ
jgi:tetratricopeptide (TPR) repeat protein